MKLILTIILSFLIGSLNLSAGPENKTGGDLKADEILGHVDMVFMYPDGRLTGRMIHVASDGKSRMIDVRGAVSGGDMLFKFSSADRDEELKILYNKNEDIWVYDLHANMLFNKRGTDRFDPLMTTNFTFVDFSHAAFRGKYTAKITGDAVIKGNECHQLSLEPVSKDGRYGLLKLFISKKDFIPLKTEYHDNEKIIFKTLSVVKTGLKKDRIVPVRYEMLDIKKSTVTLLEFFDFDETVKFDKNTFRQENLRGN